MDFFKEFQLFLMRQYIISAPVEQGVNRERRKFVLYNLVQLFINQVRLFVIEILMIIDKQWVSSVRYWIGDFFFFLGPLGVAVNTVNFLLHFGYLLNRRMFYRQEGKCQLFILETLAGDLNGLPADREKTLKMLSLISKMTIIAWVGVLWTCALPVTLYGYVHANYRVKDNGFMVSSAVGFLIYSHGIYIGFSTIYAVHGLIALSVEYTIARVRVVKRDALNLVKTLSTPYGKLDMKNLNIQLSHLFNQYNSFAQEIRQHNLTLSHLLQNEVIILCPSIAIGIMFMIVDAPPIAKLVLCVGANCCIVLLFASLINAGRVYSNILYLYPILNSIQVKLPSTMSVKTKQHLEKVIKELASQKVPSFTLGGSNPFTKTTASQFVVATISFCLLFITNSLH